MREETTVYVVDGEQAARKETVEIVRSKGLGVRECESAEQLLGELPPESRPECFIVNADLPGISGLELQQRLCNSGKHSPLVMTGGGDVRTAVRAMQQGAVTFLQRPCCAQELSAAIELALDRASQQQATQRQKDELRDRFQQLTLSERDVLARVIEGQPNRRIASEMDLGLRTVELRRSNIMRKTGATNLSELIRRAIEVDFPNSLAAPASEAGKSNGETVVDEPAAS